MTPAGTSNELDVQNEWEENTHTVVLIILLIVVLGVGERGAHLDWSMAAVVTPIVSA